ncbi:MAG TPA: Gfo/Idh/MocA family oxidoreductase [Bauldia sp.]|nr:Gfo/Idh/MocA family oxidoreductase [Bauldia sp.]
METVTETLGIGLIGSGFMGKCHALAWNSVKPVFGDGPRPRLAHLADVSADLAGKRAAEFGFARASGDWRALLADPEVDVVSITAPNAFHPEMAIAALEAGKHVWCEKPMAPALSDAIRMRDAARRAGRVAILGYNYIQNPAIRHMRALLDAGAIGKVNHVRIEMDEDFMADPEGLFFWKNESTSGYGALDDFAVHPLSLLSTLVGLPARVITQQAKPYFDRPLLHGGRRAVETYDIASTLFEMDGDISGILAVNRSAWGRKGRIAIQIFGGRGTIAYDQERMNEVQLFTIDGAPTEQGFRNILTAPVHEPYGRFIPAPGHGLGFNDLKTIECRQLINRITGKPGVVIDFDRGVEIERTVHAMARSHDDRRWTAVTDVK